LPISSVLIDDRLLVDLLTGGMVPTRRSSAALHTTTYWYHRACRAAASGGAGQLSGPFAQLDAADQERAITAMLQLPDDVGLPDPRPLVPTMVEVSQRHPRLNTMNIEAVAAARLLDARVLLSPAAATGVLAPVLDAERIRWDVQSSTG
jgi:hypothetical protein